MTEDFSTPPDDAYLLKEAKKYLARGTIYCGPDYDWPEPETLVYDGVKWVKLYSDENDEIRRFVGIKDSYADAMKAARKADSHVR